MGPLAFSNPIDIIQNININGVLGLEPVYSLLYDNDRILRNNKIPKDFYKKEQKYLPDIENEYEIKNNTLVIFPGWLKHSVGANLSQEERISISFNFS
jgi:ectoine hydroxylase-related dioxygenase (phytanoyl-CoA dioxygenase family)